MQLSDQTLVSKIDGLADPDGGKYRESIYRQVRNGMEYYGVDGYFYPVKEEGLYSIYLEALYRDDRGIKKQLPNISILKGSELKTNPSIQDYLAYTPNSGYLTRYELCRAGEMIYFNISDNCQSARFFVERIA